MSVCCIALASLVKQSYFQTSQTHLDYDVSYEHSDLMFKTIVQAVDRWSNPTTAITYLRHFVDLVGEYFDELSTCPILHIPRQIPSC